jgi:hypothetical protein
MWAKLSFKTEGEINIFQDISKLRESIASRPVTKSNKGSSSGFRSANNPGE